LPSEQRVNRRGLTRGLNSRSPALAIAAFVRSEGAAYSGQILDRFDMAESTLRRRRAQLLELGIVFIERGRGSFYTTSELAEQLRATCRAKGTEAAAGRHVQSNGETTCPFAPDPSFPTLKRGTWRREPERTAGLDTMEF
jgi:hypothetical protein